MRIKLSMLTKAKSKSPGGRVRGGSGNSFPAGFPVVGIGASAGGLELLEDILPRNSRFEGFEVEHHFPHLGRRKMKLDGRRLALKGDKQYLILLTIVDLTEPD